MKKLVETLLIDPPAAASGAHALFACSPAATLVFAANGAVSLANAAAHRMFAYAPDGLIGSSAAVLLPELWRGNGRLSVDATPAEPPRRVTARRQDGATFAARLRIVHAGTDAEPRFLATVEDLTEFERELADRAAQVVAANKEFDTLIDVAAHDLRAPLRILTGFAEALEEECGAVLNEEGKVFLKEIMTASGRMEGIIDGLLALARSGRSEMACESLDLTTLIELVYYELRHEATERNVDCQVEPGLTAWGDVRLVMTILRNLLGNAWKYTGRAAHPSIRFYSEQRAGRTWLCVTDNGAGFDMAHAGRLFKPFTRLHRQDEFPGHGIGLATVHRIVQRHGGEIEAEAALGQGATLRFWLQRRPE
jgi:PAS domain S-box-containing protein